MTHLAPELAAGKWRGQVEQVEEEEEVEEEERQQQAIKRPQASPPAFCPLTPSPPAILGQNFA